jgi:hypothetical protein
VLAVITATSPALAAKKKKKKHPPPPAATVELDAPPPAQAGAAPAAPAPAPAPGPAAEAAPAPAAEPASSPAAKPAAAPAAAEAETDTDTYTALGAKHTLVLDDLSGFRASSIAGVAYAGPIGFSAQSNSANVYGPTGAAAGTDTVHSTTLWLAPSADYFVIDKISVGAVLELAHASSSYDQSIFGTTTSHSLPSTTSFTLIPRAGYMYQLAQHWGLWPRVGMGIGVIQQNAIAQAGGSSATSPNSSTTFLFDLDLGVLYRIDPRWYLRGGPEFTWGPGANLTDFSFAAGFGYLWSM